MPGARYSPEVRTIAALKKSDGQTAAGVQHDLHHLGGSRSSIYRWSHLLEVTGSASRSPDTYALMGRPRLLNRTEEQVVVDLIKADPLITNLTIQNQLLQRFDKYLTLPTINGYRHRLGFTYKKVDSRAIEANPIQQTQYLLQLSQYSARQLICLDEVHFNDKSSNALYAWAQSGEHAVVEQPLNRGSSYSALAIVDWNDGLLGVPCLPGAYDAERSRKMLETFVYPWANSYPDSNSVLLWDNASIHKGAEIRQDVARRGMHMLHTPPYSPIYQPTEFVFGAAKKLLRREPWRKDHPNGFDSAIRELMQDVVPNVEVARRFMLHTGIKEFSDLEEDFG